MTGERWLVVLAALLGPGPSPPTEEPEAWVFFSADSPDASGIFRALAGHRVRPVYLAECYTGSREFPESFLATVRASGGFLVVDEEGLRVAGELEISRLPALAVRRGGRWHVASGGALDVREVLGCSR